MVDITIRLHGRFRGNDDIVKLFNFYKEYIKQRMVVLSSNFKFKKPCHILIRPMYMKTNESNTRGQAIWNPSRGFSLSINVPDCLKMVPPHGLMVENNKKTWFATDYGLWIINHELAHIGCIIKHGDPTHSRNFLDMEFFDTVPPREWRCE